VSLRAVQSYFATLVAVVGVNRPRRLIPAVLETFSNLGDSRWGERKRKREKSGLSKHDRDIEFEAARK
jgi:hypothetical protein